MKRLLFLLPIFALSSLAEPLAKPTDESANGQPVEFVPCLSGLARNASTLFAWICNSMPDFPGGPCWQPVPGVDVASFTPISHRCNKPPLTESNDFYARDRNAVYYAKIMFDLHKIDVGDPAAFKYLGEDWALSQKGVVYRGKITPGIDALSLKILSRLWATDKHQVYFQGLPVSNADPSSFRPLKGYCGADKLAVFCGDQFNSNNPQIIPGADPDSFAVLTRYYSKDRYHVYFHEGDSEPFDRIDVGDPSLFQFLSEDWAVSQKGAVFNGKLIPRVDSASLEIIDHRLARDKRHVYFNGTAVPGADPNSFRILENNYWVDKSAVFYIRDDFRGQSIKIVVGADPRSFRVLTNDYDSGRDRLHTYREEKMVLPKRKGGH